MKLTCFFLYVALLVTQNLSAEDFSAELPRIPPLDPAKALTKFSVADGFEIQLVASEPLLGSPVAIEWNATGQMFVCEMRGYSEDRDDAVSTIGLLQDDDDDGVYDRRTTFAEGLLWPTAIFPYKGGLFVGDAPNLYYLKDTDGDGVADQKKVVLTGFSTSNVQGLMNSMRWGLDNRIHLACSSAGGQLKVAGSDAKPTNIRGRDISIDPDTGDFKLTSGAAQHGMCFDDWGRKFVSSNSNHIQQVMFDDSNIARNRYLRAPPSRLMIAADGPQAEVFRASPVEPWRIVRTRLRVNGLAKGPVEGGGRAAGYFTGATGLTIYRGDAWPQKWKGTAYIGDVGSNLIHRKSMTKRGLEFVANRIDKESEFVTSSDIWFRPAQFANAPDGSLHVIDVCREVIEHPKSLPPDIKQHLDLTAGRNRGRIYRIVPDGFQHRTTPDLSKTTGKQLVKLLAHSNAWHRETAARLLFERQDKTVAPLLRELAVNSGSALARLHALYVLDGLAELDSDTLLARLVDSNDQVRRHAVRLANKLNTKTLNRRMLSMSDDASIDVRCELAYTLGSVRLKGRVSSLAEIMRHDPSDRWIQTAVQSSIADDTGNLFATLATDGNFWSTGGTSFLKSLAIQIVAQNRQSDVALAVQALSALPAQSNPTVLSVAGEFLSAARTKNSHVAALSDAGKLDSVRALVQKRIKDSMQLTTNVNADPKKRIEAISALRYAAPADSTEVLLRLIDSREPDSVQRAAIVQLKASNDPRFPKRLVNRWPTLSPSLLGAASEALFASPDRITVLFDAIDDGKIKVSSLPRARLRLLATSTRDAVNAKRASQFLATSLNGKRSEVLKKYRRALEIDGDTDRGRTAFKKHCSACHRVEGVGYELGPNLASMKARGPSAILENVIDPNREVNPQYLNYLVLTNDGRSITGTIVAESATTITLGRAEGAKDVVLRDDIEKIQSTGVSIMPEALEQAIDVQSMSDIITYLMQAS